MDSHNRGCSYYEEDVSTTTAMTDDDYLYMEDSRCYMQGHMFANEKTMMTADVACCVCGGGMHDFGDGASSSSTTTVTAAAGDCYYNGGTVFLWCSLLAVPLLLLAH